MNNLVAQAGMTWWQGLSSQEMNDVSQHRLVAWPCMTRWHRADTVRELHWYGSVSAEAVASRSCSLISDLRCMCCDVPGACGRVYLSSEPGLCPKLDGEWPIPYLKGQDTNNCAQSDDCSLALNIGGKHTEQRQEAGPQDTDNYIPMVSWLTSVVVAVPFVLGRGGSGLGAATAAAPLPPTLLPRRPAARAPSNRLICRCTSRRLLLLQLQLVLLVLLLRYRQAVGIMLGSRPAAPTTLTTAVNMRLKAWAPACPSST